MSYLDELNKRLYETKESKTGILDTRPWWFRAPAMLGGLVLVGVGSAITAGTLGGGAVVGGPLIATGGSLVLGSVSSTEKVKNRHALFDLAQELEVQKTNGDESLQTLKKNRFTGNLLPYISTFIPFSGARESFLETERLFEFAKNPQKIVVKDPSKANPVFPITQIPGVSSSTIDAAKKICDQHSPITREDRTTKLKEKHARIKEESSAPGTSPAAQFCASLRSLCGQSKSGSGRW